MNKLLILLALGTGLSATALADAPKVVGGHFVDENGMTLYTFDKDIAPGKSMCMGGCATKWPAALASDSDKASGDWSLIKSSNGQSQWAYKGKPLYRWSMDKKAGDTTGEGFAGFWHTAKP